jgi:hypothetical protein
MGQTTLVDQDIDNGRRLIEALDAAGFPIVVAFWFFLPEEEDWRLIIASAKEDEVGPLAAYTEIQGVLRASVSTLSLRRISVVSPSDPMVHDFRIYAETPGAPFVGGTALNRTALGDIYVERAYVYRAERVVNESGTREITVVVPDRPKKLWTAYRCKLTFKDGLFQEVKVEGYEWPQSRSKKGLKIRLYILAHSERKNGQTVGDVERWVVTNSRLQRINTIARNVPVREMPEVLHSTAAP